MNSNEIDYANQLSLLGTFACTASLGSSISFTTPYLFTNTSTYPTWTSTSAKLDFTLVLNSGFVTIGG